MFMRVIYIYIYIHNYIMIYIYNTYIYIIYIYISWLCCVDSSRLLVFIVIYPITYTMTYPMASAVKSVAPLFTHSHIYIYNYYIIYIILCCIFHFGWWNPKLLQGKKPTAMGMAPWPCQVETFCQCWCQMDLDSDGMVDLEDFSAFFSKRKVDR